MKKFFTFFTSVLITATAFGQDIELNGTVSAQNNQIKDVAKDAWSHTMFCHGQMLLTAALADSK